MNDGSRDSVAVVVDADDRDSFLREIAAAPGAVLRPLARGEVVAERFVVEHLAGAGGMGTVYRATDRASGAPVAVKVMQSGGADRERFAQEAHVLAELSHPAIVRHVAHGPLDGERMFLAMEWLDGEDLARRLAHARVSVGEALAIARRAAEALAVAHRRGIVHRDVKPSNLFLVAGDPTQLKVLDFGVARLATAPRVLTRTGAIVGTVGYMAPEQATGERDLDARADIFALGCVLFECVTGEPAFAAAHPVAILAKVLCDEAPRLSALCGDVPAALDDLVARMLSKHRQSRPADASALASELDAMEPVVGHAPAPPRVTGGEQRLVCVILADGVSDLHELVAPFGAEAARLAGGTFLVTLGSRGAATDHATRMASLALALRDASPGARIALAIGRAETTGRHPVGPAIDRAAALLGGPVGEIRIDDSAASLLEPRFELRDRVLVGPRASEDARTLLGKPTPCVGRDRELAILDATLAECISEPVARAVLVTAPPGLGKSRLRREFVQRARETVWLASADPVGAGSSLALVRQLVRAGTGLRPGEPASQQHARLIAALSAHLQGDDLARTSELLGELVGAPSPSPSPFLRAARADPSILGEWLRRSFKAWVDAACAAGPLVIVLEDVHWGDAASIAYLDDVLHALAERPLLVLALARPEVHELFPKLWTEIGVQEIRLGGLTRRAGERLARSVLGDEISADVIARIVERADGNAYYLEELIRRVAEGSADALPETILAMIESRLDRLEPEARRVLRAASIFGEVCWQGGVTALAGGDAHANEVAGWLRTLADRELLVARSVARFPGETEYAFRHGLLREACYAMLVEADRAAAHHLAGEWLERAGEKDALVLVEHFERAGRGERAIPWLLAAANVAYEARQWEAVIALAGRGIAHGATGEALGQLRRVQASGAMPLANWDVAGDYARAALTLLPGGTAGWTRAASAAVVAELFRNRTWAAVPLFEEVVAANAGLELDVHGAFGLCVLAACATMSGRSDLAGVFAERLDRLARDRRETDLAVDGWTRIGRQAARLIRARAIEGVTIDYEMAIDMFHRSGDVQGEMWAHRFSASALGELGARTASGAFDTALKVARAVRHHAMIDTLLYERMRHLAFLGEFDAIPRIDSATTPHTLRNFLGPLAWARLARGALDEAERHSRDAVENNTAPMFVGIPRMVLACLRLARGEPEEALREAEAGLEVSRGIAMLNETSALLLVRAEALRAMGDAGAVTAIGQARDRIVALADAIDVPELRETYLTRIQMHARTLELARAWDP